MIDRIHLDIFLIAQAHLFNLIGRWTLTNGILGIYSVILNEVVNGLPFSISVTWLTEVVVVLPTIP